MNRIYRRIWNAARQCWVVASELSSPRGKPAQTWVLMSALLLTTAGAAWATNEGDDPGAVSEADVASMAVQKERIVFMSAPPMFSAASASITPRGMYLQSAIVTSGNYADAQVSGADVLALGSRVKIYGTESTGLGNYAETSGGYATALGHNAKAYGGHGTAVGRSAYTSGFAATALGQDARATAQNAVAIGSGARAANSESVAIGANAVTYESRTVSVGKRGEERRITNVGEGRGGTDAVNVNQLAAVESTANTARSVANSAQTTANTANRSANDALAKASTLSGLLGETASNGNVRIGGANSGTLLDIRNSTGSNRRITGVAEGQISSSSADAVNGRQLFDTQAIAQNAKVAADAALSQVKASSYLLVNGTTGSDTNKAKATGTGALANGIYTEASGTAATAMGRTAKALAEGAIAIGDRAGVESVTSKHSIAIGTMAKTGPQEDLLAIGRNANASGGVGAMALGYGSTASHLHSVALGSGSTTSAQDQVSVGNASIKRKIVNVANGSVTSTSNEAVTGAQLFSTDKLARDAQTGASSALSKAVALEGLIKQSSVAGDIRMGSENTGAVLDIRNKNDDKRKISGLADAALVNGSSDAVTGSQLAETNERVTSAQNSADNALSKIDGLESKSKFFLVGSGGPGVAAESGAAAVAIGDSAKASVASEGAVAVGSFSGALAKNSVALGRAAQVHQDAEQGFALGVFSYVEEFNGVALGAGSSVNRGAADAVAVGAGSIADATRTVSFGSTGLNRRLVHLARGFEDHNATTVGQLNDSLATLGGGAKLDANGNVTAPTYRIQNTDQHTVGGALAILDGAVLRTNSRVDGMEGQLRSIFQDTATARADGFNQLTLAGAQGMVISNVANGLIAAGSREAVNGGQLHAVQQQLNGRIDGLEQRVEGQGPAPQSRAMALASSEQEAAAPTPPATQDDKVVADTGNAPKSSPAPQPKAESPESPKPQVDTAELEKMLARANDYSDGIAREVDARLNKMDKRFNRMAAMSSAQTAMAMNTAGLATYNRLGAGVGYAEGESAMAVGYQRVLNDKGSATFSLNGAFTNSGERSVGVGVGIGW